LGRVSQLEQLRTGLSQGTTAVSQAIQGMGGVGKTQLATEYLYQYHDDYEVIWWVRSEEEQSLITDLAGLSVALGLAAITDSFEQRIALSRNWLNQHGEWLIIFDNANHPDQIKPYLPTNPHGHVLLTSRYRDWSTVGTSIDLEVWTRQESVDYLKTQLEANESVDQKDLIALADRLGDLPLALAQAAAFLKETKGRFSITDYLGLYESRRADLEAQHRTLGLQLHNYEQTVATTWQISIEAVTETQPEALNFLNVCAYFAPEVIPLDILQEHRQYFSAEVAEIFADVLATNALLSTLHRYSLIDLQVQQFSMHRLVQQVIRDQQTGDKSKQACLFILNEAFDYDIDNVETWKTSQELAPHIEHLVQYSDDSPEVGGLLNEYGLYQDNAALYTQAQSNLERALDIAKKFHGPDDHVTAVRHNNLSTVFSSLGQYGAAKTHLEQALKIDETKNGLKHPSVGLKVTNLAGAYKDVSEFNKAKPYAERGLAIAEANYKPTHPAIAEPLSVLAQVFQGLGEHDEAKVYAERALEITKSNFGPNYDLLAVRHLVLSLILTGLKNIDEAKAHAESALAITKINNNSENILGSLQNLTLIAQLSKNQEQAKGYAEQALSIAQDNFDPDHLHVGIAHSALAMMLMNLQDDNGAKEHFERALDIIRFHLDENHPTIQALEAHYKQLMKRMA